jgi:hypothetical protein
MYGRFVLLCISVQFVSTCLCGEVDQFFGDATVKAEAVVSQNDSSNPIALNDTVISDINPAVDEYAWGEANVTDEQPKKWPYYELEDSPLGFKLRLFDVKNELIHTYDSTQIPKNTPLDRAPLYEWLGGFDKAAKPFEDLLAFLSKNGKDTNLECAQGIAAFIRDEYLSQLSSSEKQYLADILGIRLQFSTITDSIGIKMNLTLGSDHESVVLCDQSTKKEDLVSIFQEYGFNNYPGRILDLLTDANKDSQVKMIADFGPAPDTSHACGVCGCGRKNLLYSLSRMGSKKGQY